MTDLTEEVTCPDCDDCFVLTARAAELRGVLVSAVERHYCSDSCRTRVLSGREPSMTEAHELLAIFGDLLRGPTGDGQHKRSAGTKPHWTIDESHADAMLRHLGRWWNGERVDGGSGAHPLTHVAWRALALAWQQEHA